jgi:hypothetical protein
MVTSRPVLKKIIKQAEASPQDSPRQAEKAKSKAQIPNENGVLRRHELQQYVEDVFKTIENVLESVRREEVTRRDREIQAVHLQMEAVRIRLEQLIGRLETLLRPNRQEPICPGEISRLDDHPELSSEMCQEMQSVLPETGEKESGQASS